MEVTVAAKRAKAPTKQSMTVLVTGGSGFLGSHICEQLAHEGHHVRALVRRSSNRKFLSALPNLEFAEGGVEDADKVRAAVRGVDAIIHSAGLVKARSAEEFRRTNVVGTQNLIEAAKAEARGIERFVFVSSQTVAGPSPDGRPVDRSKIPAPVTHYGRSKLEAERVVLAAKDELPVTILRPAAIYGPRDNEIFAFFQAVQRGILPTVGDGSNTLSIVYGSDCADACIRALRAKVPSGSVYFVDDGKVYRLREMLEGIEAALGKKAMLRINLPFPVVYMAALSSEIYGKLRGIPVMLTRDKMNEIRQPHWVCSSVETRADLGWEPQVSLREGTEITAKWYRAEGWL
jgi:nucleoside-diphosphate-sugar epimerase